MSFIPYVISSFRAGISDEDNRGVKGSFKFGRQLNIHKRRDSLSCGQAMTTIGSGTITDLVNFFVGGIDSSLYAFGNSGKIYSISGDGNDTVNLKYTDTNGAIKGAHGWGLNDGLYYFFWATNTSLARKLLPGDDAWGDVSNNWKTTLDSADWHTMRRACGRLIICNSNYLAQVEYDGSFNAQVMHLESGNVTKCLESRGDYVIIGSERRDEEEEGHIWSWITSATNYINKKKIPVKGVNALIDTELFLLQGGTGGELFLSDFTNTEPIMSLPTNGYVNPGGVAIYDDLALFGFYGDTIYPGIWSYGRKHRNRPIALNYEYRLVNEVSGSTISQIGAVGTNNGTAYASWKIVDGSTTSYGIDKVSSTAKASAVYEGLEFDGGSPHLKKQFRDVHLIMSPLPSGCSVGAKVKLDKASSWTTLKTSNGLTSFSTTGATEAVFLLSGRAKILELGVTLTPSSNTSPEVLAIATYIEKETSEY